MAKKMSKPAAGGLWSKLGQAGRKAHEAHKDDETRYSAGGGLPPGINGVAQLVDCKFDVFKEGDNKGDYYFYAAGVVVSPDKFTDADGNEHHVEGMRTSIMEPLCATPNRSRKTIEEHLAWVYNELRKLGVDTSELDPDDLETTVAALVEEGPHFKFRTWQGKPTEQYPDPRVNEVWNGVVDYDTEDGGDAADYVEDDTEDAEQAAAGDTDEDVDLDALAEQADADDEDAQTQLTELAYAAGLTDDDIANAGDSWADVVTLINDAGSDDGDADAEAEDEADNWQPQTGEVYSYRPVNPKTKKLGKAVDVEVIAVNVAKQTVNLKDLANPKVQYKLVGWDKLASA